MFIFKSNLHISKTVKDCLTLFLPDISFVNMCKKKTTRGLFHVSEKDIKLLGDALFDF
jgi:hypothetical protein